MKLNFIIYIISWYCTAYNKVLAPTTLLNISIFIEKTDSEVFFNVFILKGEIELSDRSFQYYFIKELSFIHNRFIIPTTASTAYELTECIFIIQDALTKQDVLHRFAELASVQIRPFIFKLKKRDPHSQESIDAISDFERIIALKIFKNYDKEVSSFVLFNNQFTVEDDWLRSLDFPSTIRTPLKVSLEIQQFINIAEDTPLYSFRPFKFTILNDNNEPMIKLDGPHREFNFIKKDDTWYLVAKVFKGCEENADNYKVFYENINASIPNLNFENIINTIFSPTTTPIKHNVKHSTTFIQSLIGHTIDRIIKSEDNSNIKHNNTYIFNLIVKGGALNNHIEIHNIESNVFGDNQEKAKYSLIGDLKMTFNNEVLYTYVNPFEEWLKIKNVKPGNNDEHSNDDKDVTKDSECGCKKKKSKKKKNTIIIHEVIIWSTLGGVVFIILIYTLVLYIKKKLKKKRINKKKKYKVLMKK